MKPAGLSGTGAISLDMKVSQSGKTAVLGTGAAEYFTYLPDLPRPDCRNRRHQVLRRQNRSRQSAGRDERHAFEQVAVGKRFRAADLHFNLHVDQKR
jgi:hypothetical protein